MNRLNHKVDRYISWKPAPHSVATDAFSVNWGTFKLCYALPPFALVGKVVNKSVDDKAKLILVAPFWNTQYWLPLILDCLVDHPLPLPVQCDTVRLPHDPMSEHPIWAKLNLHCFRLSGR